MSLIPMLFSDWWEDLDRPHRIFDQHFGLPMNPEDLLPPSAALLTPYDSDLLSHLRRRRNDRHLQRYQPYRRNFPEKSSGASTVEADKDKFQVTLDVQQFAPDELAVKVVGKNVVVEGKHEEKRDEHGWISRQFVRKYLVPEQCDIDQIKSALSSDGVLTVAIPRKEIERPEKKERIIEIEKTGRPALDNDSTGMSANSVSDKRNAQMQKSPVVQQRAQEQTVKAA